MNSKGCWKVYDELIAKFGNEFNILLNVSKIDLIKVCSNELLARLILRNRDGNIKVKAGYDGEYGVALLEKTDSFEKQKTLF